MTAHSPFQHITGVGSRHCLSQFVISATHRPVEGQRMGIVIGHGQAARFAAHELSGHLTSAEEQVTLHGAVSITQEPSEQRFGVSGEHSHFSGVDLHDESQHWNWFDEQVVH